MQLVSFYRFTDLPDCDAWRDKLSARITNDFPELRGTILLAEEGVNAVLCGQEEQLEEIITMFHSDTRFADMEIKRFPVSQYVFKRMKIRCKPEIVSFRIDESLTDTPAATDLNTTEWNELMNEEDILVFDVRNAFEYDIGSFPDAINPQVERFSHLATYVDENKEELSSKKIAIYCTGGIRCEKIGKYMKKKGIEDVYQLQGGILKYLQEVQSNENLWEGECFVFDERIDVKKKDL